MSLASLLEEINLIKESPKLKVASRIHVFYEGLVTEKELIDFYHQSIRVHKNIFLFVDISDGGSYNSLTNIVSILRDQVYEDVHGDMKRFFRMTRFFIFLIWMFISTLIMVEILVMKTEFIVC